MMKIKRARQILKAFSDDTRLRIVNLLNRRSLTVTEICQTLKKNQSIVSKHLAKLRLTGIVRDIRKGANVHYYLIRGKDKAHDKLVRSIAGSLLVLKTFKQDLEMMRKVKKKG
ncbi:MAG: metalloregulator ArsR/SmtB family transcription factor [Candidatus Omnitrophica bacterium]|nr:metalloregulator ArsR/SmtB family transcription factor [Candidatus Omnitrophota bacterium]